MAALGLISSDGDRDGGTKVAEQTNPCALGRRLRVKDEGLNFLVRTDQGKTPIASATLHVADPPLVADDGLNGFGFSDSFPEGKHALRLADSRLCP